MKTAPVNIPAFRDLGNPAFAIETPIEHIALGSITLCVAKKQSGPQQLAYRFDPPYV